MRGTPYTGRLERVSLPIRPEESMLNVSESK